MKTLLYTALALAVLAGVLVISELRERRLMRVADCVIATAKAQGFYDPYSRDAWVTFAPLCK